MSTSNPLIEKITLKIRHRMVIRVLLRRLSLFGLIIQPYFLEREFYIPATDLKVNITPKIHTLTTNFLEKREIESIFENQESDLTNTSYKIPDRISDGCLCFGVKYFEEIIAYTWCDLKRCTQKTVCCPVGCWKEALVNIVVSRDSA